LDVDALMAGRARWTIGVGIGNFLGCERRKWLVLWAAKKALRLGPKMLVSKRLGGDQWAEKGCSAILQGVWEVVVRCCVEMVCVEIFCWTGFWGWCAILKSFWGRGLGRLRPAEVVFLTGVTM
jgi:hypothetical protein